MRITFIIPSRNNLKYLQQAVNSIHECYGNAHDIVLLDDASNDGTWDWIQTLEGDHIIKYRNTGPDRLGHTILYDQGVILSRTDVFTIFHADMIVTPNYVPNLIKHLKSKTVVAATRIEPPIHPPGPEKYVKMFGFEPTDFDKNAFITEVATLEHANKDKTTNGIFAPWCMYKRDFIDIGGHDPLFAPMELEDSDLFNRMHLVGYELIQSRDAFVYHMTCRGSRFKDGIDIEAEIPLPDGTIWYKPKDSEEYINLRKIKFREWWRKWKQNVLHNDLMLPIVHPVYNIHCLLKRPTLASLTFLEPWFDSIILRKNSETDVVKLKHDYINREQPNTKYDLNNRIVILDDIQDLSLDCIDVFVETDGIQFNDHDAQLIQLMSQMIDQTSEYGIYVIGNLRVEIYNKRDYKYNLIKANNELLSSIPSN